MSINESLADVLDEYLQRDMRSTHVISALTANPPLPQPKVAQRSIANWLSRRILKPRRWQDLVKIALVLRLTESETNRLLRSGGHLPINILRQQAKTDSDRALLAFFQQPSAASATAAGRW